MKTSELTGAALDWAVAKCEGASDFMHDGITMHFTLNGQTKVLAAGWAPSMNYHPSTDWTQSGPIIERERIAITPFTVTVGDDKGKREWFSNYENAAPHENAYMSGDTPLVAAMRCLVASKLGGTIDIPEELK